MSNKNFQSTTLNRLQKNFGVLRSTFYNTNAQNMQMATNPVSEKDRLNWTFVSIIN
jgi:hypothetical protein